MHQIARSLVSALREELLALEETTGDRLNLKSKQRSVDGQDPEMLHIHPKLSDKAPGPQKMTLGLASSGQDR